MNLEFWILLIKQNGREFKEIRKNWINIYIYIFF